MNDDEAALLAAAAEAGLLKKQHGKRFSLTGKLSMKREDMVKLIQACGGIYDVHPVYGTTYLIAGDTSIHGTTAKMREARARGTMIISENEWVDMIRP